MALYSATGKGWPDGLEIGQAKFEAPGNGKSYRYIHEITDWISGRTPREALKRDRPKRSKDPSQRLIQKRFVEQRGICHYCKKETPRHRWSLDHKVPICRGGTGRRDNLIGACKTCNNAKGNLTEEEFLPLRFDSCNRKKLMRQVQIEISTYQPVKEIRA